jgi:hypothetical protein
MNLTGGRERSTAPPHLTSLVLLPPHKPCSPPIPLSVYLCICLSVCLTPSSSPPSLPPSFPPSLLPSFPPSLALPSQDQLNARVSLEGEIGHLSLFKGLAGALGYAEKTEEGGRERGGTVIGGQHRGSAVQKFLEADKTRQLCSAGAQEATSTAGGTWVQLVT